MNRPSKTEVESDLAQRLRACWRRIDPTSTDDDPVGMTMASALLAEAASAVEYLQAEHDSLLRGRRPTHRCKVCGALWIEFRSFWSLFSPRCGQCCDNAPDFLQKIVLLPKLDESLPVETKELTRLHDLLGDCETELAKFDREGKSGYWQRRLPLEPSYKSQLPPTSLRLPMPPVKPPREPDLTCDGFVPDPHSSFCDKCGYPEREHRRTVKASERIVNPDCGVLGCTADHSKSK